MSRPCGSMRSSAVSGELQNGHHAASVLVRRTVDQFWLYLQACCALEVDKDQLAGGA